MIICLERGAHGLHMVHLMPLHQKNLIVSCLILNPDWFNLSGTGLPMLSWKRGLLMGVVVVVVFVAFSFTPLCFHCRIDV